ncbi:MAG: hypothetical protein DI537_20235 [Stutzerimonas stutzeri]|nr:MAG: hypothetical protein DI537_20235 [Stutzerimonas stutzeri]
MAELPLNESIPRFKANENRIDLFTNGGTSVTWQSSGGQVLPSIAKFLADKNNEINVGAASILELTVAARDIALGAAEDAEAAQLATDKRYLGSKAADPSLDNQGAALLVGAMYWNTSLNPPRMRVYQGSGLGLGWTDFTAPNGSITREKLALGLRRMMERTFTPFEFGAVGDGITDDREAIQAAFDALKEAGGGTLDLTGDFQIVDGIAMHDAVDIRVISNAGKITYPQTSFSYMHCFRVTGDSQYVVFENLEFETPDTLVREDTGFAIQISGASYVSIKGCHFKNIASACVWIDNTDNIIAEENSIEGAKADGIHLADNCWEAVISNNIINGTEDDAIAVVQDAGAGTPHSISIAGNEITNVVYGHGIVLISCDNVTVSGNTITNTAAAGIGNYAWTGTAARANGLLITGNRVFSTGGNAANDNNCCNILLQACENSLVVGNSLSDPHTSNGFGADSVANIRLTGCVNTAIMSNYLRNSEKFGISVPIGLGAGMVHKVWIVSNVFENIALCPAHMKPVGLGEIAVVSSLFINSAYLAPYLAVDIANAGSNRISLLRNSVHGSRTGMLVDQVTCTNVVSEDNSPVSPVGFNANPRNGSGGNFTSASHISAHWMSGGMVFCNSTVTITTRGATPGLLVTLPYEVNKNVAYDFHWVDTTTGAHGVAEPHPEYDNILFLHGSDPTGDAKEIRVKGWYVPK